MAAFHVYSFLKNIDELKTKKEKIEAFQKTRNVTVDKLLQLTFGPAEFELPDSEPPYKRSEFDEYGNLHQEIRKIERTFVKGSLPNFNKVKRENLFIQVLEYVDKDDSTLLTSMIQKTLPFKTINKKLVQEALPELFANEKV
jgi:hypothetical protein